MPGTAETSNRFDGGIRNASFEAWDGADPTNYDTTLVNASVIRLTRDMENLHRAGIPQVEMTRLALPPREPLVKDGLSAVRFVATGVWAARDNNIRVGGVTAALLGAADFGLPWNFDQRGRFMFWARGTAGKQIELVLGIRNAAQTLRRYFNTAPGTWGTGQTGIAFSLSPSWQRHVVETRFSFVVDDGGTAGENAGLASTDSLVFGFYNVSVADPAATPADPFVFDLDGLSWQLDSAHGRQRHEEA